MGTGLCERQLELEVCVTITTAYEVPSTHSCHHTTRAAAVHASGKRRDCKAHRAVSIGAGARRRLDAIVLGAAHRRRGHFEHTVADRQGRQGAKGQQQRYAPDGDHFRYRCHGRCYCCDGSLWSHPRFCPTFWINFAGAEGGIGAPAGEGAGIQAFLMQISQLYISAYFNDVRSVLLLKYCGTQGIL